MFENENLQQEIVLKKFSWFFFCLFSLYIGKKYIHTIQSFINTWSSSTRGKTKTCKFSRWKKLSSPYRQQWPLEQNCSEHYLWYLCFGMQKAEPVILLPSLSSDSRLNYFSSSLFHTRPTVTSFLQTFWSTEEGPDLCVINWEGKKKRGVCRWQTVPYVLINADEASFKICHKYFRLNISNTTTISNIILCFAKRNKICYIIFREF